MENASDANYAYPLLYFLYGDSVTFIALWFAIAPLLLQLLHWVRRVIYPANQKQVLFIVTNNDPASVYLIQSWIENAGDQKKMTHSLSYLHCFFPRA